MHVMVKSMNFCGGGGAESLHYKFSLQEKRVRGWGGGLTVKKKIFLNTCKAWSVKINQLKLVYL